MVKLVDHMRLGPAELAREHQEALGGDAVAAKLQHLPAQERVPDLLERRVQAVRLRAEAAKFSQQHTEMGSDPFYGLSFGTSSHFFCCQLLRPSSASCTPLAASSRPQRKGPSPTTCLRKSSHCTLKALSVPSSGTSFQPAKKSIGCGMSGFHTGFGVSAYDCVKQRRSPATALPSVPSTWMVARSSGRRR